MRVDAGRFDVIELFGDVFLLDREKGTSQRIGQSGARLWELFKAGAGPEDAASTLAREVDGDPDIVLADTRRLLAQLVKVEAVADLQ